MLRVSNLIHSTNFSNGVWNCSYNVIFLNFHLIVEMAEEPWEIFYHSFLNGRSAYIRLIFEELGIPYKDMVKSKEDMVNYFHKGQLGGYPVLFPPVIRKGM